MYDRTDIQARATVPAITNNEVVPFPWKVSLLACEAMTRE